MKNGATTREREGEKRKQGRKEGKREDGMKKRGREFCATRRRGKEERERESGEKGDRNFSSCRKNVRALCARTGATSFLFLSLEKRDPEPRFRASRRLGEGENSVFSSPRFSPS